MAVGIPSTGSSGAVVKLHETFVTKHGDERVGRQGRWLYEHRNVMCLPRVTYVADTWYTMEKLKPFAPAAHVPFTLQDRIEHTFNAARLQLWVEPAEVPKFDGETHLKWLAPNLVGLPSWFTSRLHNLYLFIDFDRLKRGLTHGDLILDNTMQCGGRVVFIDPIPATPAVPDIILSDVGRLLQSLVNYEETRYESQTTSYADVGWFLTLCAKHQLIASLNDVRALLYFAVVHTLRGRRTAPTPTLKDHIFSTCVLRLLREVELWMPWFSLEDADCV